MYQCEAFSKMLIFRKCESWASIHSLSEYRAVIVWGVKALCLHFTLNVGCVYLKVYKNPANKMHAVHGRVEADSIAIEMRCCCKKRSHSVDANSNNNELPVILNWRNNSVDAAASIRVYHSRENVCDTIRLRTEFNKYFNRNMNGEKR